MDQNPNLFLVIANRGFSANVPHRSTCGLFSFAQKFGLFLPYLQQIMEYKAEW